MSADSFAKFLARLQKSRLLDTEQWGRLNHRPEMAARDLNGLANYLCHKGWLTKFQVQELAKGRGQRLILGHYRLLDKVGEGGMGQVFKAHHDVMNRVVAFKVIADDHVRDPRRVQRFYQEIRLASQLTHPNIVTAYDAGQLDDTHYFVMEYVEGTDLAKLVMKSGPLPIQQACDFIRQAALGLEHAHRQGLIHRDIKPSNLIVTRGGPDPVVKILDMGLARLQSPETGGAELTRDGMVVGSPAYIAPEQGTDPHHIDARADLYSLGCTLYYLLTANVPFSGDTPMAIMLKHQTDPPPALHEARPDAPAALEKVLLKMLAKKREERYASARAVAEALTPFCPEIVAELSATAAIAPRPSERKVAAIPRAWLAAAIVSAFLAVGGLIFVVAWLQGGNRGVESSSAGRPPANGAKTGSTAPAAEDLVTDANALYSAMKLTDFRLDGGPYHAGETARFRVLFVHTGKQPLAAVPMEKSRTKYGIGMAQFYVERLGNDDSIPCLDGILVKIGRKYAAGAVPVECLGRIAPQQEVILPREVRTERTNPKTGQTDRFPPGKYRYFLEYRSADFDKVIQPKELDFELLP